MKRSIIIPLLAASLFAFSNNPLEKGLRSINKESAEAQIHFLASDALEGREAGKTGARVAGEYIKARLQEMGVRALDGEYFRNFEAYSPERQRGVRYSVNSDSITKYKKLRSFRLLSLRNVLGIIEGQLKDEYVVIGAHYDHLGIDEDLLEDQIYNGADDNASGVSASLQIAKAFVESGIKPKRSIIFAFWDGEELGLLGSEYFMLTTPVLKEIKGYLNFDMIGRNNEENKPKHVIYFYTEDNPSFGRWLREDIENYNLALEPDYRAWDKPIGGSDNSSFAKRGIPIIWYHTDGHLDYHQPTDHADLINYEKLVDITKAAYLNLWNLANEQSY